MCEPVPRARPAAVRCRRAGRSRWQRRVLIQINVKVSEGAAVCKVCDFLFQLNYAFLFKVDFVNKRSKLDLIHGS